MQLIVQTDMSAPFKTAVEIIGRNYSFTLDKILVLLVQFCKQIFSFLVCLLQPAHSLNLCADKANLQIEDKGF